MIFYILIYKGNGYISLIVNTTAEKISVYSLFCYTKTSVSEFKVKPFRSYNNSVIAVYNAEKSAVFPENPVSRRIGSKTADCVWL
ncbi:MAG: hypothetical protein K2O29_11160 [Ruminococcus sp.]|nr:hypothetical protein [Ruminococcus sp.]MDE7138989.1 hypothetical protein [Ruminococcus sp.]